MVGGCVYHVRKAYNLYKIYEHIRIAASSVLVNSYNMILMIRLSCVGLLGYVSRNS
uniref:Uncharacterized protein n=1 Tax=Arundo donax TaxID=35708 RepID=A0A0A8ZYG5_ARUDO